MGTKDAMSVAMQVKGMEVVRHDSEERLGHVRDVIVHPTSGRVLGLLIETPQGKRRAISAGEWSIRGDVITASPHSTMGGEALRRSLESGVLAARRLLGMKVVTDTHHCLGYNSDRGKYLGHIRDVFVVPGEKRVVYRVHNDVFLAGDFYLAGSVPSSYSRADECMEVPRRTPARFAAPSPRKALDLAGAPHR